MPVWLSIVSAWYVGFPQELLVCRFHITRIAFQSFPSSLAWAVSWLNSIIVCIYSLSCNREIKAYLIRHDICGRFVGDMKRESSGIYTDRYDIRWSQVGHLDPSESKNFMFLRYLTIITYLGAGFPLDLWPLYRDYSPQPRDVSRQPFFSHHIKRILLSNLEDHTRKHACSKTIHPD